MTPEAREIIGKARRSFGFSIAILLLGFIAIVLALVYRSMRDGGEVSIPYVQTEIGLPADAQVVSVVPSQGLVTVVYTVSGKTMAKIVDGATGTVVNDITFVTE